MLLSRALLVLLSLLALSAAAQSYLPSISNVPYDDDDPRQTLDVFLPEDNPGEARRSGSPLRPAILMVHGGSWLGGDKESMIWDARFFASRGYICVNVNYRLLDRGGENRYPTQVWDVRKALEWMRNSENGLNIDPDRIAGIGVSAGGHILSHLALPEPPDLLPEEEKPATLRCAILLATPCNLLSPYMYFPAKSSVRRLVQSYLGSDPFANRELARLASPMFHVSEGVAPIMLIHGMRDPMVTFRHSLWMRSAVEEVGGKAEVMVLPFDGHTLSLRSESRYRFAGLEFLEKHMKPSESAH